MLCKKGQKLKQHFLNKPEQDTKITAQKTTEQEYVLEQMHLPRS